MATDTVQPEASSRPNGSKRSEQTALRELY